MFGEKLKAARRGAGLSLRELETKIGNKVSAQAIGKYEQGKMQPSPEILSALVSALGISEDYLLSTGGIQLGTIEFRENFIRSKKEESQVEATILRDVSRYLEIEELLQIETIKWDQPRGVPFIIKDLKDADLVAHEVRDDWKIGDDPIPSLAEFLENRGIKIIPLPFPDSVAGVTCFIQRQNFHKIPVIVINKGTTAERQRFTLAHELGHLIIDKDSTKLNIEDVCNRFASAFLMPNRILYATLGKNRRSLSLAELISVKQFFGVSVQAIARRCKDLEIITPATYQNLFREFARRGWLKPPYNEPGTVAREIVERFRRLCFRALSEGAISFEKAAELLGETVDKLKAEINYSDN